jgi:AcrR family transcriptional regulator
MLQQEDTVAESSPWLEFGESELPRILGVALGAFAEHGYHGTSIRDIAARAGLSVPGLYHHYRSKQDILMDLMVAVMEELLRRSRAALASTSEAPAAQRLDALLDVMLRYHMYRREQAFVASSEIRSLALANRLRYVAMRDEQQGLLADVIDAGVEAGEFHTEYASDAARALSTLCIGVATWYRADGPLEPHDVVVRHIALARALVRCD